jgi:protein SCO1/2
LFAVCVVLAATGCGDAQTSAETKQFTVRGIVRGISPDQRTLDIQHEAIPNYMPEMTMPFVLKEPKSARDLKAGDAISFRFLVGEKDAVIDQVTKVAREQVQVAAPSPLAVASGPAAPRLKSGDEVPRFRLTNEKGELITPETFRGHPFVVTFIFTRCPVPNFCPLMSKNFAQLQDAIRGAPDTPLGQTKLLSISFDPEFDTPAVLKQTAESENADPSIWSFATGERRQIDDLTKRFAVMVQPEGGTLSHGLATALVGGDGRIVEIWRGNGWKPSELLEKIAALGSQPSS